MQSDGREDWELTPDEHGLKTVEIRKRQNFLDETLNYKDPPKPKSKLWHLASGLGLAGLLLVLTLFVSTLTGFWVGNSAGCKDYAKMKDFFWEKIDDATREANHYKNKLERISSEFQQYKEKTERAREVRTEY